MYRLVSLLVALFAFVSFGDAAGDPALDALVQRRLSPFADKFVFDVEPQVKVNIKTYSALDTFTVSDGSNDTILVQCSSRSACARGLYTYLPRKR
jgi:hypothetical protein